MGCEQSTDAPSNHQHHRQQQNRDAAKVHAALLKQQDDRTSEAVLNALNDVAEFVALSEKEGMDIIRRDMEDEAKLGVGIQIALNKGVLSAEVKVDPTRAVDVAGKTADAVANEILSQLKSTTGNVIVLQGLSGTGKGTTTKKLQDKLSNCVTWSNGNVFRALTHLASLDLGESFSKEALTDAYIDQLMQRLTFAKFPDGFDVVIDGTIRVSSIQNSDLKMPHISARVPTVAELTQGEVIRFTSNAVERLKQEGYNVILEGRAQTLNYIETADRYALTMSDPSLLGRRRAAQRVMAHAANEAADQDEEDVTNLLLAAAVVLSKN